MVISDLFDEYVGRISPLETELERARKHRDNVVSRIYLDGVQGFINSGSYIKKTAIRPFEDIDVFIVFNRDEYEKDEAGVVTRLAYHLSQSFPSRVRTQRHSIGVTFADGVRVDVVPGFALKTRPGYHRIRNRIDARWVETNIDGHKEFYRRRYESDRRFRDLVKLAKAWKNARRLRIGSYLMELLLAKAFAGGIPQGRDVALNAFFTWMASGALKKPIFFTDFYRKDEVRELPSDPLIVLDPTNWKNNVAGGLSEDAAEELKNVADRARARSGTALQATSRKEASRVWGDLLPDFPVR